MHRIYDFGDVGAHWKVRERVFDRTARQRAGVTESYLVASIDRPSQYLKSSLVTPLWVAWLLELVGRYDDE